MATFIISGNNGGDLVTLKQKLVDIGLEPLQVSPHVANGTLLRTAAKVSIQRVGLLVVFTTSVDEGYDHNSYYIDCDIQNLHTADSVHAVCRKDVLHKHLSGLGFTAPTWDLSEYKFSDATVIMRPSHMLACSGLDIKIVCAAGDYEAAAEYYRAKQQAFGKVFNKTMKYYQTIVSEYITKPMLLHGRKMHLRLCAISTTEYLIDGSPVFDFAPVGELLLARLPYIAEDWQNKDIHDTHFSSTGADYMYPDAFPRPDILPAFRKWLEELAKAIKKFLRPESYPQAKASYMVYGLDIMFWEDGRPVLIEINDRPGLTSHGKNEKFYDSMYSWETSHVARLLSKIK